MHSKSSRYILVRYCQKWRDSEFIMHPCHPRMHTYRDLQLTPNFELWGEIFVWTHISIWGFQNRVCPSVCPYPEKRNHLSFVNTSPTLLIDISMERSSRVLQHENPEFWISFQKRSKLDFDLFFDLCWKAEITLASSISILHQ